MPAAVFKRSLVILVCGDTGDDTAALQDGLTAMGFTVLQYASCHAAASFPAARVPEVHAVLAGCDYADGPTGGEAVETLYRHFLGVPLALLDDGRTDEAARLGATFGFSVLTFPVGLDELARVMVKAHFDRPS